MTSPTPQLAGDPDGAARLADADALEGEGRLVDAIEALTEANRWRRDAQVERRLVRLRHDAFRALERAPGPRSWPAVSPRAALAATGPPVVTPAQLTAEALSTGILRHGCLHVPGLIPPDRVEALAQGIDRAIAACDAYGSGTPAEETTPWFEPFQPNPGYSVGVKRKWVRDAGGVWAADSPRLLFELLDTIDAVGLGDLITEYLGERPVMSVNKCTLRRVTPDNAEANWHQDGAFLGRGIRTVDVWMSLSRCGRDAPGLDIVPRRFDHLLERGTGGAIFDWAVGPTVVEQLATSFRPDFEPGDVLLFDDMFLHRTAVTDTMTQDRYAVETWFFAPSVYPDGQIPLVY